MWRQSSLAKSKNFKLLNSLYMTISNKEIRNTFLEQKTSELKKHSLKSTQYKAAWQQKTSKKLSGLTGSKAKFYGFLWHMICNCLRDRIQKLINSSSWHNLEFILVQQLNCTQYFHMTVWFSLSFMKLQWNISSQI